METYRKKNVNLSKGVRKDRVFLGLAGLLLEISLGLRPREIPRSSPASQLPSPSFPPLLLRLTQNTPSSDGSVLENIPSALLGVYFPVHSQ